MLTSDAALRPPTRSKWISLQGPHGPTAPISVGVEDQSLALPPLRTDPRGAHAPQKLSLAFPGKMWSSGTPSPIQISLRHHPPPPHQPHRPPSTRRLHDPPRLEVRRDALRLVALKVGDVEPVGREAEHAREQVPRHGARLALEVVAKGPVAKHLEEGVWMMLV